MFGFLSPVITQQMGSTTLKPIYEKCSTRSTSKGFSIQMKIKPSSTKSIEKSSCLKSSRVTDFGYFSAFE